METDRHQTYTAAEVGGQLPKQNVISWQRAFIVSNIVIAAAFGLVVVLHFGSIEVAVASLGGNSLVPDNRSKRALDGSFDGTYYNIPFILRNIELRDITVIGYRASCGCMALESALPLKIGSHKQRQFIVKVQKEFGGDSNQSKKTIFLFTDSEKQSVLELTIN